MGEIVLSSDDEDVTRECEKRYSEIVKWEKFLPKMVLRVLLVEVDDSTRQIIAALLRKCSYKVVAVADGLKAWEVIKRRPQDIDLILTEVDLPSISGFALLTLINEHEFSKSIPIIMMSSYDSVNIVYKCMLRGAVDFLMKPIRRNELINLWQHVWRRQSATAGVHGESNAEGKIEAVSENNEVSNNSSGSIQRKNTDPTEKGIDTQSSYTKQELEVESACIENGQDLPQAKPSKSSTTTNNNSQSNEENLNNATPEEQETHKNNANIINGEACDKSDALEKNLCREAIDLIGTFDDHMNMNLCSIDDTNKMDSSPQLNLSLRRSHFNASENQVTDAEDAQTINHSNFSPFSRYQSTDLTQKNQSEKPEIELPCEKRMFPAPVQVKGISFDSTGTGYGSVLSQLFRNTDSSSNPNPSSNQVSPFNQTHFKANISKQIHNRPDQNNKKITNQITKNPEEKLDSLETTNEGEVSPTTDCSVNSNFWNGNHVGIVRNAAADSNIENNFTPDGNGNFDRSIQREAALIKFRLKRKDRCYEKKVRYESRKKLAEQRPRIKGQFVRQGQTDPSNTETENYL